MASPSGTVGIAVTRYRRHVLATIPAVCEAATCVSMAATLVGNRLESTRECFGSRAWQLGTAEQAFLLACRGGSSWHQCDWTIPSSSMVDHQRGQKVSDRLFFENLFPRLPQLVVRPLRPCRLREPRSSQGKALQQSRDKVKENLRAAHFNLTSLLLASVSAICYSCSSAPSTLYHVDMLVSYLGTLIPPCA